MCDGTTRNNITLIANLIQINLGGLCRAEFNCNEWNFGMLTNSNQSQQCDEDFICPSQVILNTYDECCDTDIFQHNCPCTDCNGHTVYPQSVCKTSDYTTTGENNWSINNHCDNGSSFIEDFNCSQWNHDHGACSNCLTDSGCGYYMLVQYWHGQGMDGGMHTCAQLDEWGYDCSACCNVPNPGNNPSSYSVCEASYCDDSGGGSSCTGNCDCPEGEYWDGYSCYDCDYCCNIDDDSDCDPPCDCAGMCGCTPSLTSSQGNQRKNQQTKINNKEILIKDILTLQNK